MREKKANAELVSGIVTSNGFFLNGSDHSQNNGDVVRFSADAVRDAMLLRLLGKRRDKVLVECQPARLQRQ